jgi:SAM-dependent methyltransferase
MLNTDAPLTFGTGSSAVVDCCQVCGSNDFHSALFLGYLPPVNQMWEIGQRPHEQPGYPAELLWCGNCALVQLGLIVDAQVLFPPGYPYTSGTTKILHENFQELREESVSLLGIGDDDLVVDIGSNDGTLLSKFGAGGHKVYGIEPTDAADLAIAAGIPTTKAFFTPAAAEGVKSEAGKAKLVTATNCFAHIENIHNVVDGVLALLDDDGVFVSESHYLIALLDTVQYDTIYHEHLRYYSLTSLKYLLESHGLEIIHARPIPTHGGSIRVYAALEGARPVQPSVAEMLTAEAARGPLGQQLEDFKHRVVKSKVDLHALFSGIKANGERIYGISAPSRASTLANYAGIDDGVIDCVLEIKGSKKIGRYLPGTMIPVVEESKLFEDQPEYALILAWHIADDLALKLRSLGYSGKFIVPLPEPRII